MFTKLTPRGPRIQLGEEFHFQLKANFTGSVLVLQSIHGAWYLVPLTRESFSMELHGDCQTIPCDPITRHPTGLVEDSQQGCHDFVFIIAKTSLIKSLEQLLRPNEEISTEILDQIALMILHSNGVWKLLSAEAMFVPWGEEPSGCFSSTRKMERT